MVFLPGVDATPIPLRLEPLPVSRRLRRCVQRPDLTSTNRRIAATSQGVLACLPPAVDQIGMIVFVRRRKHHERLDLDGLTLVIERKKQGPCGWSLEVFARSAKWISLWAEPHELLSLSRIFVAEKLAPVRWGVAFGRVWPCSLGVHRRGQDQTSFTPQSCSRPRGFWRQFCARRRQKWFHEQSGLLRSHREPHGFLLERR